MLELDTYTVPAVHALLLVSVAQRWKVSAEELLTPLGLDERELADPSARMTVAQVEALIERARELTGEPGLGFHMGLSTHVGTHGFLGFAAMSAATVRDALELTVRFAATRTAALRLHLHEGGDMAALVLEERTPLGRARDFVVISVLVGIWRIGVEITGRELEGTMELAFPEPPYMERFAEVMAGRIRFDQPSNRLVFPTATLALPMKMADPAALRLTQDQLERELHLIGDEERSAGAVRRLVAKKGGGFCSLVEIASALHVSVRTLKRRLAAEGTSFRDLLDTERRERALLLVRSPELSLDEVAERLGYSDVANFTRAFRRWTGTSPGAFRRSSGAGRPGG